MTCDFHTWILVKPSTGYMVHEFSIANVQIAISVCMRSLLHVLHELTFDGMHICIYASPLLCVSSMSYLRWHAYIICICVRPLLCVFSTSYHLLACVLPYEQSPAHMDIKGTDDSLLGYLYTGV